jgi:Cof subfamily protein (haloacid dehalogenase superfamily)
MAAFYVSDLDGTLLRDDARLSHSSRDTLGRLIADGLAFSVASARSVISMQPLLRGLELKLPVVEFNGAFISDLSSGRHETINSLDPDVATAVFALLRRFSDSFFVSTYDGSDDRLYYGRLNNAGEQHYVDDRCAACDPRLKRIDDLAHSLTESVVCLTVIGRPERLADIDRAVTEEFSEFAEIHLFENRYSPGWWWLTIHDRRATKDQAIKLIAEQYDLADHELIVFGDHVNDLKMFRLAKQAIAVANAQPEVLPHATHVIGSNEEDSVIRYIEAHFSGRGASC